MPPLLHPPAAHSDGGGSQVVFVPVDGRVVFWCCALLIVFCLVWLGLLLQKGVDHDRE